MSKVPPELAQPLADPSQFALAFAVYHERKIIINWGLAISDQQHHEGPAAVYRGRPLVLIADR